MKRILLGLWFGMAAMLLGVPGMAQARQEVVLSATAGTKLGVAMPPPQVNGLDKKPVHQEFYEVVLKDLEILR